MLKVLIFTKNKFESKMGDTDPTITEEVVLQAYVLSEDTPREPLENEGGTICNPFLIRNMGCAKWLKIPQSTY